MFEEYFTVMREVRSGQSANRLLRIQIFHTAIFIGKNIGGYGAQLFIFAPTQTEDGYKCRKFGLSFTGFSLGKLI